MFAEMKTLIAVAEKRVKMLKTTTDKFSSLLKENRELLTILKQYTYRVILYVYTTFLL